MKISVNMTVNVNEKAWATEYFIDQQSKNWRKEVREDVKKSLKNLIITHLANLELLKEEEDEEEENQENRG